MAIESFYEESAINLNEKKQKGYFNIFHVLQIAFTSLAVIWVILFGGFLPFPDASKGETFASVAPDWIFFAMMLLSFIGGAVLFNYFKKRFNISYDYACVYGELRISKVFNQRKRKLIVRIDPASVVQVGDIESPSFDRLCKHPGLKQTICTPNDRPANGKFFMYLYVQQEGTKKLFLLECREALLLNLMQYLRRDILDREYVPQDKKM